MLPIVAKEGMIPPSMAVAVGPAAVGEAMAFDSVFGGADERVLVAFVFAPAGGGCVTRLTWDSDKEDKANEGVGASLWYVDNAAVNIEKAGAPAICGSTSVV